MTLPDILPSLHTRAAAPPPRWDPEAVLLRCKRRQRRLGAAEPALRGPGLDSRLVEILRTVPVTLALATPVELAVALAADYPPTRLIGILTPATCPGLRRLMVNAGLTRYLLLESDAPVLDTSRGAATGSVVLVAAHDLVHPAD
jgi:hypothetical protein